MFALALHGGAGTLTRAEITPQQEKDFHTGLRDCLDAGYAVLEQGGSALDAVEQAVIFLENNPLFNAGRGSVFNAEGSHEFDAAIMDGTTLKAGAVAAVRGVRNPVTLARAVMDRSENVLLAGPGAEDFARLHGLPFEPDEYFFTDYRLQEWRKAQLEAEHANVGKGTVGAVALDASGNLAAATSTGGIKAKKFSRVGDTPVIGGGTYANNAACAVSCTGDGEFFIRAVAAYDVFALVSYRGLSLVEASRIVVQEKLRNLGGEGGLIAVDRRGNLALPFNGEGMYRAWRREGEAGETAIF